ncbi:MAG: hypothetical protein ACK5G0_01080 [Bacteroidota bacterium]|jgi:hypothetical protein
MDATNFTNEFGSITDKKLTINYKNGSEEILIEHISSVSFNYTRNYVGIFIGIALVVFGTFNVRVGKFEALILAGAGLLVSIANWVPDYTLTISVAGVNRKPIKIKNSKKNEGLALANALRQRMG